MTMKEQVPKQPMTMIQALEAYQRGDQATFDAWYFEQQRAADQDPSGVRRFEVSVELARIQFAAGDLEKARETISGVNMALQEELVELDRLDSSAYERPDKEEYRAKLKSLLQNVVLLRNELRR